MSERLNISSGTRWEAEVGYSRAVRVGAHVWVAGTTAVDEDGRVIGEGDPGRQAAFILRKIERALAQAGATMGDVVRTRMFVTSASYQDAVGRAHADVFRDVRPAATMVEVVALVDSRLLVEIEADAYIQA